MGKCPYCSKELHIEDFFQMNTEMRKGKTRVFYGDFKGEYISEHPYPRMWVCPFCDIILGFTTS